MWWLALGCGIAVAAAFIAAAIYLERRYYASELQLAGGLVLIFVVGAVLSATRFSAVGIVLVGESVVILLFMAILMMRSLSPH